MDRWDLSVCLLRAPLVLLRAPLVLKNTAQKFLIHKTFWWCRNICPEPCPGTFYQYFRGGAALSFFGAGRGSVEIFRGRGGPGQPFLPGAGRGVHPWWWWLHFYMKTVTVTIWWQHWKQYQADLLWIPSTSDYNLHKAWLKVFHIFVSSSSSQ